MFYYYRGGFKVRQTPV